MTLALALNAVNQARIKSLILHSRGTAQKRAVPQFER